MEYLIYASYNSRKSTSKTTSSPTEPNIGGVIIYAIIFIVAAVIMISGYINQKRAEEEKRNRIKNQYAAEEEQRKNEEARKKAEEERQKKEKLRQKQEQELVRRQVMRAEFERQKITTDKSLEQKNIKFDKLCPKLYNFQEQAITDLLFSNKKFCILPTGAGKTAVMFNWLKYKNPKRVLIVTTASKRDSGDFEIEADAWCGTGWKDSLKSLEIISWHTLYKWYDAHYDNINDYVFAFDEVHNAGGGNNSRMGKAFMRIARSTDNWTGYTATPGDEWKKFVAFFIAAKKINSSTYFERRYTIQQLGRGYSFIVGYRGTDELEEMWRDISTTPDASSVFEELPGETEKTIHFNKPSGYDMIVRSHVSDDGDRLDSIMALCHALRQKCCSKQKLDWISDFIDGLETNAVFFYNYVDEGDKIVDILKKKLPKESKIWRIDGRHHNIPTKSTIGQHDIVVAQYSSGSNSLNLQFISHWIGFSPNYSHTLSIQAKGRIKRIGQQRPMFFYYFRTDGTIEDAIYNCLSKKEDFSEKVWAVEEGLTDKEMSKR